MRQNESITILVTGIGEEETNRNTNKLKSHGFQVISASSGTKARELVAFVPDIDLIMISVDTDTISDRLQVAEKILNERYLPILFRPVEEKLELTEVLREVPHYGFVSNSTSDELLVSNLKSTWRLFNERKAFQQDIERSNKFRELLIYALDNSWSAVLILDKNRDVLFANQTFIKLAQLSSDEVMGASLDVLIPNLEPKWKNVHRRVLAGEKLGSEKDVYLRSDGSFDWVRWESRPWYDPESTVGGLVFYMDIIPAQEQKAVDNPDDSISDARWIDFMNDTLWIIDFDGKVMEVNQRAVDVLGYSRDELIPDGLPLVDPAVGKANINQFSGTIPHDVIETTHTARDGTVIPVEISVSEITWRGKPAVMSVARDIRHRKEKENQIHALIEDKEFMLKEVHHRVKNNLSVLQSLLMLESDAHSNEECRSTLDDAVSRINSIVVLYDLLYRTDKHLELKVNDYLPKILQEVVKAFDSQDRISTRIDIPSFSLSAKVLSSLGIMVNELCTNSMKYAFKEVDNPEIALTVTRDGKMITISYSDNGAGLPEDLSIEDSESFGLRLVQLLTAQLNGSMEVDRKGGTRYTIHFELVSG